MKPLNLNKIREILQKIQSADVISLDNSPLLQSWEISEGFEESEYDPSDIIISFNWSDDEWDECKVSFTAENLSNAKFGEGSNKALYLLDSDGQECSIHIYNLVGRGFTDILKEID